MICGCVECHGQLSLGERLAVARLYDYLWRGGVYLPTTGRRRFRLTEDTQTGFPDYPLPGALEYLVDSGSVLVAPMQAEDEQAIYLDGRPSWLYQPWCERTGALLPTPTAVRARIPGEAPCTAEAVILANLDSLVLLAEVGWRGHYADLRRELRAPDEVSTTALSRALTLLTPRIEAKMGVHIGRRISNGQRVLTLSMREEEAK